MTRKYYKLNKVVLKERANVESPDNYELYIDKKTRDLCNNQSQRIRVLLTSLLKYADRMVELAQAKNGEASKMFPFFIGKLAFLAEGNGDFKHPKIHIAYLGYSGKVSIKKLKKEFPVHETNPTSHPSFIEETPNE